MRRVAVTACVSVIITCAAVLVLHLKHPERALASVCESSYTLNWSIPSTYTVTGGSVNSSGWSVQGSLCYFYSPLFNAGGNVGDPEKIADLSVRINQSDNLDANDTAWVYIYTNGIISHTYSKAGNQSAADFTVNLSANVPAGGTYQIVAKLKNDKTNELWQIKNGDITACLRSNAPLPGSIVNFETNADNKGKVIKTAVSNNTQILSGIKVYPDPFTDKFFVEVRSETEEEISVRLLTMEGKIVWSEKQHVNEGQSTLSIDPPSKFTSGNYMVQVVCKNNVIGSANVLSN